MNSIAQYLDKLGFRTVRADNYDNIRQWRDWYSAQVDKVHERKFYNGLAMVEDPVRQLGLAKHVCEDWANLLMNEKVAITTGNDASDKKLMEILTANNFRMNANQLVEKYMALGTGAFVEYLDKGQVRIDFIDASMIYPLTWDNRGVDECAFGSIQHQKDGDFIYLQIHTHPSNGLRRITNKMLLVEGEGDSKTFKEVPLPAGVEPEVLVRSDLPLFQIVKPNIINNYDMDCPLGMSVYGNCLDVLEAIDVAFDALHTEVTTGRRMVFFSSDLWSHDKDGNVIDPITKNEKIFRYIPGDVGEGNPFVMDYSPNIRSGDIKALLQQQINLLSLKCGMGTNQYTFEAGGLKTATEVISEDSDMYTNLKKHELVLQQALTQMVEAIGMLAGFQIKEVVIDFDDSIIEDKATERNNDLTDLANGTLLPYEYRMKWRNETEEVAKAMVAEASGPDPGVLD